MSINTKDYAEKCHTHTLCIGKLYFACPEAKSIQLTTLYCV